MQALPYGTAKEAEQMLPKAKMLIATKNITFYTAFSKPKQAL
jgi:hypothetical protein